MTWPSERTKRNSFSLPLPPLGASASASVIAPNDRPTMNRKSRDGGGSVGRGGGGGGGGERRTSHKRRRRWNGGGGRRGRGGGGGDESGPRDLASKVQGKADDGYGYCASSSSDSDDDGGGRRRAAGSNSASRPSRRGGRTFGSARTRRDDADDDDADEGSDGESRGGAVLPTPRGWDRPPTGVPATFGGGKAPAPSRDSARGSATARESNRDRRPPTDASKCSGFTLSSARKNPYAVAAKTPAARSSRGVGGGGGTRSAARGSAAGSARTASATPSTSRSARRPRASRHVVCAVSENLARETCVATLDASRPNHLQAAKQGNGQTYAETMALLRSIRPDEVLLNEGRKNGPLAVKICQLFGQERGDEEGAAGASNPFGRRRKTNDGGRGGVGKGRGKRLANRDGGDDLSSTLDPSGAPSTSTVVKFVPRHYFDQTKGSELLRRLARENSYDPTLVEEYVLLSSCHAALQYAQLCLGAGLCRGTLDLDVHAGGGHRMRIDRSTAQGLELLANASTGRAQHSLVGTIDCTRTSAGGRLLRTNLMAPPAKIDTINARLDLVDSLLEDEEFFYAVLEHLEDLPDVDKMLSHVALGPKRRNGFGGGENAALFGGGEKRSVTARAASRGISALVCIKSALSAIPSFARVVEAQLRELDERERASSSRAAASASRGRSRDDRRSREREGRDDEDESTTIVESEVSRDGDGGSDAMDRDEEEDDGGGMTTADRSSLQLGLGTASTRDGTSTRTGVQPPRQRSRHQLLRAILVAMRQPALSRVLDAVSDIFTESTSYSKNAHAMRHQECFALRPNTDGMMDVLRKAFLANVDDIYRLADEYAERYDVNVQVRETASRGYYLSVTADLGSDLPQEFIQPVKSGRFIHCTTEEVYSLNSRAQENVQDLLLMTHTRIQEVLQVARDNYDCIASLADAVALLDMCHCFADNVASSNLPWCRPILSTNRDGDRGSSEGGRVGGRGGGAIAIRNGRYAIDVSSTGVHPSTSGGEFVPNDTYSSALQNFTVITGKKQSKLLR
ncbi:hypothetical protein ACHAWF_005805, partial [Thalassiosira exigua]